MEVLLYPVIRILNITATYQFSRSTYISVEKDLHHKSAPDETLTLFPKQWENNVRTMWASYIWSAKKRICPSSSERFKCNCRFYVFCDLILSYLILSLWIGQIRIFAYFFFSNYNAQPTTSRSGRVCLRFRNLPCYLLLFIKYVHRDTDNKLLSVHVNITSPTWSNEGKAFTRDT